MTIQQNASIKLRRSALFMPASNQRALEKAAHLDCDVVLFDLEDAVADNVKPQARTQLQQILSAVDFNHRETVVRLNAINSPHFKRDLACLQAIKVENRPNAVLLPMVETAQDIASLQRHLHNHNLHQNTLIWAMIETPLAVLNAQSICQMSTHIPAFDCLVLGPNDLALATDSLQTETRQPMLPWISHSLLAAKAYGLDFLDGVYTDIENIQGLYAECMQGVQLGATGKTVIHPSHLAQCNACFSPDKETIAFSTAVVEAFSQKLDNHGVLRVQGKMVEHLHLRIAQKILAKVALINERQTHPL